MKKHNLTYYYGGLTFVHVSALKQAVLLLFDLHPNHGSHCMIANFPASWLAKQEVGGSQAEP